MDMACDYSNEDGIEAVREVANVTAIMSWFGFQICGSGCTFHWRKLSDAGILAGRVCYGTDH